MDKDKLHVKDKHCGSQPGHIKIHNDAMAGWRIEWKTTIMESKSKNRIRDRK